jgi:putative DNA primase/helicase
VLPDPERDLECCRLPLTDLGNAERWRARYGDDFRFCAEMGWFAWDGRRWRLLSEEKDRAPAEVLLSVFRTVRGIRNEAALVAASGWPSEHLTDKQEQELRAWAEAHGTTSRELYLTGDDDGARARWLEEREPMDIVLGKVLWSQKIAAWAKTSEGAGKLNSVATLAKAFPDIAIKVGDLDGDRMAINVLNGTLRFERGAEKRPQEDIEAGKSEWRTGGWKVKLHPHAREDLITKLAPVKYSSRATCAEYDDFVARVQPDIADRRFLHQWGGLSLTGDISEQKLAFFYGAGRNGKGTWVEAVAHLAGDYAGSIPIESFLDNSGKRRGDQATPDIARLPGVRFLRVSEPEKGAALNEGLVKMVTGGDPVDARHLNKGFFTFLPSFKMTISGNHKPKIKDTSDGIWRRMQLLPWQVQIPQGEVDRKLPDKLRGEASGILNRLIEGLLDWLANGLIEPDSVRNATRAYRADEDDLGRFLAACCEVSENAATCRARASELYEFYTAWAEAAGGSPWKLKGFNAAMRDKGFEQKQSNGMWWLKVQLQPGLTIDQVKAGEWGGGEAAAGDYPPVDWDDPDPFGAPPG